MALPLPVDCRLSLFVC